MHPATNQMRTWAAANREGNKTIGILADLIEWLPQGWGTDEWRGHLDRMVRAHMRIPLYNVDPGPLWDPLWVGKALRHVSPVVAFELKNYAAACRDKMRALGHTRLKDTESIGLSLVDGRPEVLREHLPWIAHQVHRADGIGPLSLGDHGLARQWGQYKLALRSLG
jgi:hypothetical protein